MKAVVLLSGGQDSVTVLHWAKLEHEVIAALSFDYGQRHRVEIDLAKRAALKADVPWVLHQTDSLADFSASSLTNTRIGNDGLGDRNVFADDRGLPPSFTPGRNLLFFTLGAMLAAKIGAQAIVTGVCQQDRQGYPDCRKEFIEDMQYAVRSGFAWSEFSIVAPLLHSSKADTWRLAQSLGILDEIIERTNTCYEGNRELRHEWGYGCGVCGACVERAKGYEICFAPRSIH